MRVLMQVSKSALKTLNSDCPGENGGSLLQAYLRDSSTMAFLLSQLVGTEALRAKLSNLRHMIRVVEKYKNVRTRSQDLARLPPFPGPMCTSFEKRVDSASDTL